MLRLAQEKGKCGGFRGRFGVWKGLCQGIDFGRADYSPLTVALAAGLFNFVRLFNFVSPTLSQLKMQRLKPA